MDFIQYVAEFSYPTAIIASYVAITIIKQYTQIDSKHYLLVAVCTGIIVVIMEEYLSTPITVQKIIAGALSGVLATMSYEAIHKIVINRNKK